MVLHHLVNCSTTWMWRILSAPFGSLPTAVTFLASHSIAVWREGAYCIMHHLEVENPRPDRIFSTRSHGVRIHLGTKLPCMGKRKWPLGAWLEFSDIFWCFCRMSPSTFADPGVLGLSSHYMSHRLRNIWGCLWSCKLQVYCKLENFKQLNKTTTW